MSDTFAQYYLSVDIGGRRIAIYVSRPLKFHGINARFMLVFANGRFMKNKKRMDKNKSKVLVFLSGFLVYSPKF